MSLPRMSWHIGDYKKDTGHLRAAGHGAYFLLCMHYWATGGVPNDDKQLAAIACMTDREWKQHREIIKGLFKGDGTWKHKRIERELVDANAKYERRSLAGSKGGIAKANAKQNPSNATSNATANAYQPITDNLERKKEDSEPTGSDASASRDIRKELFDEGLTTLARITGKTPDSCRALVGKLLKSVNDEAIHVLGAIQDAERNRVADPVAWINRALAPYEGNRNGKPNVHQAARDLSARVRALDDDVPAELRDGTGGGPVRLLSAR